MDEKMDVWYSRIGWFCLLGDGSTGLMLLLAPLFTLQQMGVHTAPLEPVFIRYIGIFVLSAGLFYAVPRLFAEASQRLTAWKTVFICTAGLRILVAVFVTGAWACGLLECGWLAVSAYDASLALAQAWVLWRSAKA